MLVLTWTVSSQEGIWSLGISTPSLSFTVQNHEQETHPQFLTLEEFTTYFEVVSEAVSA